MARRENNFDLVRFLAAFEVVIGHSVEFLPIDVPPVLEPFYIVVRWFSGVPIFFALSGYLLAGSLERNPDLLTYGRNRALRIFPALWACAAVTAVLLAFAGVLFKLSPLKLAVWVIAQMTAGQTWTPAPINEFGTGIPNPSLWTIRVEIGFYILLPLLLVGGRALLRSARRIDAVLVGIAIASFATYTQWGDTGVDDSGYPVLVRLLVNSPVPFLFQFLVGVLLQRHDGAARRLLTGRVGLWAVLFLVARGLVYLGYEFGEAQPPLPLFAIGLANLLLIAPAFAVAFSASPLVRRLRPPEDISYGLYLWHMVVINAIVHWSLASPGVGFGITIVASILLGHLSWTLVESPALARKERRRPVEATTST